MGEKSTIVLGDFIDTKNLFQELGLNISYHQKIYFPDWASDELTEFYHQVFSMAPPSRPLKCSDTFKLQAGYPHELTYERKQELLDNKIQRDNYSEQNNFIIPKLTLTILHQLMRKENGVIEFTTPSHSNYIRDIRILDDITHSKLVIIYVLNRKAQVLAAWTQLKKKGKFIIKKPRNENTSLFYQIE